MKRNTVVSLAVSIPLGAGLLLGLTSPDDVRAQSPDLGTITLQVKDGSCQPVVTERIRSKRGRVVQWNVTNSCGSEQTLRLADFRLGGQSRDPLGCAAADREKRVGNNGTAVVTCPVKNDTPLGRYTYVVALGGQAGTDPELEIEN